MLKLLQELLRIKRLFWTNRRLLYEILDQEDMIMAKIEDVLQATSNLQLSVNQALAKIQELKDGSAASEAQLDQVLNGINNAKSSLDAAVNS